MIYKETIQHHVWEFQCRCGEAVMAGDTAWVDSETDACACSRACLLAELDAIRDRNTFV